MDMGMDKLEAVKAAIREALGEASKFDAGMLSARKKPVAIEIKAKTGDSPDGDMGGDIPADKGTDKSGMGEEDLQALLEEYKRLKDD